MKRKTAAEVAAMAICFGGVLFFSGCGGEEDGVSKGREYRRLRDELGRVVAKEVQLVYEADSDKAIDRFYDMSDEDKDKAIERLRKTIEEGREALRKKPFRGGLLMRWIKSERKKEL